MSGRRQPSEPPRSAGVGALDINASNQLLQLALSSVSRPPSRPPVPPCQRIQHAGGVLTMTGRLVGLFVVCCLLCVFSRIMLPRLCTSMVDLKFCVIGLHLTDR